MSFERSRLKKLIKEQDSLDGMRAAFKIVRERQIENLPLMPDLDERKKRLRELKSRSVGNAELFKSAVETLQRNGFRVMIARDNSEAMNLLMQEIGNEKLVVKSKSNISKELDIVHCLSSAGIEVIETDLGDRIIQLSDLQPVHPTGPAAHLTRFQIAEILSRHFNREIPPVPEVLAEAVREELDKYFNRAKVAITGANAIAASEGAIVLVHNEGNVTRCSRVPAKHIILTTPEKVLPTIDDAINLVKLQTYYATGKTLTAYIEIISSCSYTSDIEKKLFKGMHGPKKIVVIFLDSGRMELGSSELLYCIGCGNCLLDCPVYDILGPSFGSKGHMGGIGVALTSRLGTTEEADADGLFLCTSCGSCKEQCPTSIDIRPEIYHARNLASFANLLADEHNAALSSIQNYDNPWLQPRSVRAKWARDLNLPEEGEVIFYPGCSQSLLRPNIARMTVELLRDVGIDPAYLAENESCCGSIARKLGDQKLFEMQISRLLESFAKAGVKKIITSCPGCLVSLNIGKELTGMEDMELLHVTQALSELLPEIASAQDGTTKVSYHDPCELGRTLGIYDSPRELINSLEGVELIELERFREQSVCCGAGSGIKSGYPELAEAIAKKRLKMAEESGASVLLTSCPWCLENLFGAKGDSKVAVEDLIEFIHRLRSASKAE